MSLTIRKAGLLSTLQGMGRYGYGDRGINPSGAMDRFALQIANIVIGNEPEEPALELFYPAGRIQFNQQTIFSISGADFSPQLNGIPIKRDRPVFVKSGAVLDFSSMVFGQVAYLAVKGGFDVSTWLGKADTNLKANAGGWQGRALDQDDEIPFKIKNQKLISFHGPFHQEKWEPVPYFQEQEQTNIFCIPGPEWNWLEADQQQHLKQDIFTITSPSDRMGYRLRSNLPILRNNLAEMKSVLVDLGTIQLLPNGQLIVLMADHQTTGGYPRIGSVVSTYQNVLAQKKPGDTLRLCWISVEEAISLWFHQREYLRHLQIACILKQ